MSDKAVYRTAPATLGLLMCVYCLSFAQKIWFLNTIFKASALYLYIYIFLNNQSYSGKAINNHHIEGLLLDVNPNKDFRRKKKTKKVYTTINLIC